jgi:hypothetical protein
LKIRQVNTGYDNKWEGEVSIWEFAPAKCDTCDFRFPCWTEESTCCPLKAVRLVGYLPEYNRNLGKFSANVVSLIGKRLYTEVVNRCALVKK